MLYVRVAQNHGIESQTLSQEHFIKETPGVFVLTSQTAHLTI